MSKMDVSFHMRPREPRSGTNAIPYTKNALERDLERVHDAWDDCQADRRRDAIYGYLKAVYDLVSWWSALSTVGIAVPSVCPGDSTSVE
jgi:hypothetical protein